MRRWLARCPLHLRLTGAVLVVMLLLGAALLALAQQQSHLQTLEATQRLHLDLARTIARQQPRPLIAANGAPDHALMRDLAMHVMALNPAVEVYLLDVQGHVLSHALDKPGPLAERVDMTPVRPLAQREQTPPELPLLGDDPRRAGQRNVVSVEGLNDGATMTGYLYIVLQGHTAQAVAEHAAASRAWQTLAIGGALLTASAGAVLALVLGLLTKPLRALTAEVTAMHPAAGAAKPAHATPARDEVGALRAATHAMHRRIAEQLHQLQDNDRLRRELISNISHDLHTPLAAVQGYVETLWLRGEQLDAATRTQHLATTLRHVQRLNKRIADLFELAKLDAGHTAPRMEVFALAELLQDVVQDWQLAARDSGVRLQLAPSVRQRAPGDDLVRGDISLIERVLQNLVDNALRHTPAGGDVTLGLAPAPNTNNSHLPALCVTVTDTGSGIAREHLPHIFERYWRADPTPAHTSTTSAGLGLAIAKRILDLHGSVVRVLSEPQRGTRFEFSLQRVVGVR
jgi:two-component system, OmpR family, sensor kinase